MARLRVTGSRTIQRRLKKEIKKIERDIMRALLSTGRIILSEAKILTPVDTGQLINSGFVAKNVKRLLVRIGFDTSYAPAVHEKPESTAWQKEGAESHFLLKAVQRNIGKLIDNLRKYARR